MDDKLCTASGTVFILALLFSIQQQVETAIEMGKGQDDYQNDRKTEKQEPQGNMGFTLYMNNLVRQFLPIAIRAGAMHDAPYTTGVVPVYPKKMENQEQCLQVEVFFTK